MTKILTEAEISAAVGAFLEEEKTNLRTVLLIPPDGTRSHSGAGLLTQKYYDKLEPGVRCDVMPALGTHAPMSREELTAFFPGIPEDRFFTHNWKHNLAPIGRVPGNIMTELSGGRMSEPVTAEVNRALTDGGYDLIISIGQVVPHEVVGMANYSKNILVGCGGLGMINASHMLSVYTGFEKYLGKDHSPVRRLFDYVQENFLSKLPLAYAMTVTTTRRSSVDINGLFIGRGRGVFEDAVKLSQKLNIITVGQALKKCVVYLEPETFRTSWLGNKAVYRTRNALADGAELIILFPGFKRFGEDLDNDRIIRRYGYRGRDAILNMMQAEPELERNMSAAAHLIHGSSDGRFTIRYCTPPQFKDEILSVGYEWGDVDEYTARYKSAPDVYYIDNPALGLWQRE